MNIRKVCNHIQVYKEIVKLLEHPDYKIFAWVGSGLQKHYGHITIAHQDVYRSIPEKRSADLLVFFNIIILFITNFFSIVLRHQVVCAE